MAKFKDRVQQAQTWLGKNLAGIGRLLIYLVVIGLGLVIISTQREKLVELARARPLLVPAVGLAFCALAGLAFYWRSREPESWMKYRDPAVISLVTVVSLLAGFYLIGAASHYADEGLKPAAIRAATGWGLGYFAGGFLVGFLFGVPRVLQGDGTGTGAGAPGATAVTSPAGYRQLVNTNLEQISDWLTKIIVGLGLVELRAMPARLHRAAEWMAQSLTNKQGAELQQAAAFACGFILYFAVVGFLAGYLLTRLYLSGAFGRADQSPLDTSPSTRALPTVQDEAARIRAFWKPKNALDPVHEKILNDWLYKNKIEVSLTAFLEGEYYGPHRLQMVKDIAALQTASV